MSAYKRNSTTSVLYRCLAILEERRRHGLALSSAATSEDIAHAAAWLCSDRASFVTGHDLMVDGGYTAR